MVEAEFELLFGGRALDVIRAVNDWCIKRSIIIRYDDEKCSSKAHHKPRK